MSAAGHRSIGEVLSLLKPEFPDVTISKIRFLETRGLLEPERTSSGYRKFSDGDIEQLRWILTQQRDNFLPLKVIKDKLESGEAPNPAISDGNVDGPNPLDLGSSGLALSTEELADAAGLTTADIRELVKGGLVQPIPTARGKADTFDEHGLAVARAAAGFLERGVEVRHLKSYRIAAEREVGLIEQLTMPLLSQKGDQAHADAVRLLGDLTTKGGEFRLALLRQALQRHL